MLNMRDMWTVFLTAWVVIGAALFVGTAEVAAADHPAKPNIIYVMADDLGYGDLGSFGQEVIATPHLDRLRRQGMKFTDHYAGNTVCRPSRLVLWTGMHAGHAAISSNEYYKFENNEPTVAELLKRAGYATGGVGKWAMGGVGTTGHPNRNGFDYWFGYLDQTAAHNYYPEHLWENTSKYPLKGNKVMSDERPGKYVTAPEHRETYSHDVMTDKALAWIRNNAGGPFLFHAHYTIPHTNNQGGRVTGNGQEVPSYEPYADKDWPEPEKGFAAMIHRLDRDMGRLMELLNELGIAEDTLIIFTSDNGPHQEGGHKHAFFDSNGPLRGYKRDLYEGGIRVPTIARWPGTIEPGTTTDHPSAFQDFLPTACELAGVKAPENIDGISFLPTLLGNAGAQKEHDYLYFEYSGKRAVRQGKWKAVRLSPKREGVELYNLNADIGEQNNVADQHPEIVKRMKRLMREASGE